MSKYHSQPVTLDGIRFDSRKEGRYYLVLKARLQKGEISDLQMQVPFELIPAVYRDELVHLKTKDKTIKKCIQRAVVYKADFVYIDNATGQQVVVDVKGGKATITKEFILKKKMMLAFKDIDIQIV